MKPRQGFGADKVLRSLDPKDKLEDVVDVINQLTQWSSAYNRRLSFSYSFNGFIARDVGIAAGSTVKIEHFLGVIPFWRIILRQVGNGVITDIPSEWDDKTISIKNNGSEAVTITLLIARE